MANGPAAKQRKARQDALREWLSEKCTAQHLVDNIQKIEKLDPECESFSNELNKYRVANEQRLKILDKYLPSLKAVEHTGEGGQDLVTKIVIEAVESVHAQYQDTE